MAKILTEDQRATLTCALRLAADKYQQNGLDLRGGDYRSVGGLPIDDPRRDTTIERLAVQFEVQAKDARAMAEMVDDALTITFTTCSHQHVGTVDDPQRYECMDCGAGVPRAI